MLLDVEPTVCDDVDTGAAHQVLQQDVDVMRCLLFVQLSTALLHSCTNSGTYENNREAVEKGALAKLEGLDYETNSGTYENNREIVEK